LKNFTYFPTEYNETHPSLSPQINLLPSLLHSNLLIADLLDYSLWIGTTNSLLKSQRSIYPYPLPDANKVGWIGFHYTSYI